MTIVGTQVSVGVAPTLVVDDDSDWQEAQVKNMGASAVFLGASDVAITTGYSLAAGESISVKLNGAERLYGIVASGTVIVGVLRKQVG
jgi:hypothetical protein